MAFEVNAVRHPAYSVLKKIAIRWVRSYLILLKKLSIWFNFAFRGWTHDLAYVIGGAFFL